MKRSVLWLILMFCMAAMAQDKAQAPSKTDDKKPETKTAQTATQDPSKIVPVMDAGLGACTAEFHVTDKDGKPVYGAQIHTLIKHGAFAIKKIDLQVSTNYDGKAKFTGLPDVNKRPTFFDISQGQKKAERTWDPGANCHPTYEVMLGTEVVVDDGK